MSGKSLLQAFVRWPLALILTVIVMLAGVTPAMAQHTSVDCPIQTATVERGSSVEIDVTDCDPYNFGFGNGTGLYRNGPSHGSAIFRQDFVPPNIAKSVVIYTHNGNTATSDSFEFEDLDLRWVRVQITITPPASAIVVSPTSLPALIAGTPFSQTLSATGGTAPYTYSLSSGSLPIGLNLSAGGTLSGTPTQRGGYSFVARAQDSVGAFVSKAYSGIVQAPTLTLSPSSYNIVLGVPTTFSLSTVGGVTPHRYQTEPFVGVAPAPGLTMSAAGVISGTPTTAGSTTTDIRVTDASTPSNAAYFELERLTINVVAAPTVSIAVAPASVSEDGATNLVYTVTRSATSASPLTVNLSTSGTATSGSDYSGSVSSITIAANAASATVTINPTADVLFELGETVVLTITAGSGYSVGSPALATGTISNDEVASSTPSSTCPNINASVANGGTVIIDVSTCDDPDDFGLGPTVTAPVHGTIQVSTVNPQRVTYTHNGNTASSDAFVIKDGLFPGGDVRFNITISPPTSSIIVAPVSLAALTAGATANQNLSATGGTAPYTFTIDGGSLPSGLTLSASGLLAGAPTVRGSYSFSVRAQDSLGAFASKGYTGSVANPALSLTANTGTAIQTVAFSQTLVTNGGVAPYVYALETGSWPAGISLSSAGVISGTTNAAPGNFPVTIRITDASTGPGSYFEVENFTLTVSPPPSVSIAVAPATVAEDGAANLVYTVTRSLNLSSPTTVNIAASGTATAGTDYTGGVATVTIPAGATTASVTIDPTVDALVEANETVILNITGGPSYSVGTPGSATGTINNDDVVSLTIDDVTVNEGNAGTVNATFTVSLSAPAAPGGVNFTIATADGTATAGVDYVAQPLVGRTIPTGSSTFSFTVQLNGDALNEANETFLVNITSVTGATVVDGQGVGTIVNDDPLPSLSINDVTVTEGNSGTVNAVFTVTLSAASGQAVAVNYATADGTATQPADYTATSGSLTFAAGQTTRTITVPVIGEAVPEANETFFVNLSGATNATITDNQGFGTITNDDVPVVVSPGSLPNGTVAVPYSQTVTASGGASPYSFTVTAGALPTGLTLSSTGVLAGTPTAGGSFNFTVTGTDSSGAPGPFSGTQAYNVTIAAPTITLSAATLAGGTLGSPYSASLTTASGGTPPYGYAVTAGALPGGLTLNAASGAITGTPSALGSFTFSVTATDSSTGTGPYAAIQSYAISVIDVAPVASASSLTVAYNAPATNAPLTLSAGTAISLAIGTSPANGVATVSGTTIRYQPGAGYAGSDSFTYTATNSGGTSAPATVGVTVSDPVVSISASGGLAATVAAPYSQTFTFNGGATPWSGYQVTTLPSGLSITGTTANSVTVSGTPTQAGSFNLNVSATDSSTGNGPFTVGQAFTLTVAAPTLALSPAAAVLTAPYGAPYLQAFTASGGIGSYIYTQGGTLPAGLSFSGGSVSGTPTVPGSFSFSITATDNGATGTGAPFTVTRNYTLDVPSPTIAITPASLPGGTAAASYAQTISATGGVSPLSFAISSGALPAGLTLSNSGSLSGTPIEVGSFTFSITATDSNGQSGSRSYALTVAAPALALTPASGSFTVAYGGTVSQGFTASGGNGPYSYAATGSLPSGITLNSSSGALSGSTIAVGSFNFTVTATDTGSSGAGAPFTVVRSYSLTVAPPVIVITPASIPGATVGSGYSRSLSASGGAAPYSFAVTAGALPVGLTLSSTGVLSGTPTAGGPFNFTVTVSDSSAAPGPFTAAQAYTLTVAVPVITLPSTALPGGVRDTAYAATLNPATGGIAPFSYAVTGGALPSGMTLSSSGVLSGSPTAFGSFSFTATATDSSTGTGPYSATQSYTIAVVDQVPIAGAVTVSLPYGAAATPITLNLTGSATSLAIAAAPLNGTATVSGTTISYQPNASFSGTDSFSYTATNGGGTSSPATVTITVGAPTLSVTATGPLTASVGAPYAQTFSFAGGTAPFGSHQVTGLPAGLALTGTTANSVTLSGTPRAQGTFTLLVSASDSSTGNGPFVANQSFTLTVAAPNLAIAPASGSFASNYANPFSQSFAASGGVGPYSYALGGSLPTGVTLNAATGSVSGTPTNTGSFAFTVTATDTGASGAGAPFSVQGSYTLAVTAPVIAVTPATIAPATAGTAYSVALAGSGAVAPYSFTLSGGTLPPTVTLSATGLLSGTPTASGSFPFTVTVRDANGQTGTATLTLVVNVPTIIITPATLPNAVQGIAYNQSVSASGGVAPYSFTVSSGTLPVGLALNTTTGAISGTPTGSGATNFAITVTDSTSGTAATATITYALQIVARPNPANDPEVRGLVQAQVMATRRFADAQVNNFMRRLESLHGRGGGGGFQNSLRFMTPGYCQDSITASTNGLCAENKGKLGLVNAANAGDTSGGEGGSGSGSGDMPWTVWAGGTIRFGDRDPNTGRLSQKFESEGITFGGDYRFSTSFAAGIGVGLGRDTVDIGDNGSRSRGEAKTVAVYGSHKLGSGLYFDWLGGYQALDFDLRRYVTPTGLMVNSRRTGRQWFAAASMGADIETGNWLITPYARIDMTRGRLYGYTEKSGSLFDLTFLDQDVDFTSLGLGTRINYRHIFKGGALLPRLRIEYHYDLERNAGARVGYFDQVSGPFSTIPFTGVAREQLMLGAGAELQLEGSLALELEYLNRIASGSGSDQSVQVGVKVKF